MCTPTVEGQNAMEATKEERKRAILIKEAAQADPDIDCDLVSDLEFLAHAFVAKDSIPKAKRRLKNMQQFKEFYGIRKESLEDAMRDIEAFDMAHPDFLNGLGAFSTSNNPHVHFMCLDLAQFDARKLKSEESFKIMFRALYHNLQALQPSIAAMRAGAVFLIDAENAGTRNFSIKVHERSASLLNGTFPFRIIHNILMNGSPMLRFLFSILKPFMSKKMQQTFTLYRNTEEFLLYESSSSKTVSQDSLPQKWGGTMDTDNVKQAMEDNLKERYALEESFRL